MKKSRSAATSGAASKARSTNKTRSATRPATRQGSGSPEKNESLLEKFFLEQLKDIYYAEKKLLQAIPLLEEACTTEELKEAFSDHRYQTEKHVQRLEKVFKLMNQSPVGKKCEAIEGIIRECQSIISETQEGTMTRDAALIMAAQKVEHYEIATYGGLVQFAITMDKRNVAELLDRTLLEEEDTDCLLTDIAETYINIEAEEEEKYSWNQQKNKKAEAEA